MKNLKLFKSGKPKNIDPTPLALPPETPIHARHTSQASQPQPQPRNSLDTSGSLGPSNWEIVDARQDDPNVMARTRKDSKPNSLPSLPLGASLPQSNVTNRSAPSQRASQQQPSQVQSKSQPLRSPSMNARPRSNKEPAKRRSGHIFPWSDDRIPEHYSKAPFSDSNPNDQRPPSIYSFETRDNHEVSREREGSAHKGGAGGWLTDLFASNKDVPRQVKQQKDEQYDIDEVLRHLGQTSSEDWSIVLNICEQVSHSEAAAKDVSRGLRKAFKYGQAGAQLAAARLWAVILRNTNVTDLQSHLMFLRETSGRKFMEAVEDVLTNPKTEPVVRERLRDVLSGATFHYTSGDRKHPYAMLWRKLKPKGQADQGTPFDFEDPMFKPPTSHSRQHAEWSSNLSNQTPLPPIPSDGRPRRRESQSSHSQTPGVGTGTTQLDQTQQDQRKLKKKQRDRDQGDRDRDRGRDHSRAPTIEEQIRVILAECEAAHGKARLLSENVALANPDDVEADTGGVIQEFYAECVQVQQRIMEQISWATAEAEKSREREAQAVADSTLSLPAIPNGAIAPQMNALQQKRGSSITKEEEMLGVLLGVNQALTDAIKLRDDWQRAAIAQREEQFIEERSRVETRIDRSQMYMAADGSLYAPESDLRGAGSSRTPSPSPRILPKQMGGSSVSSFDEGATPLPQNRKQSYAQQQSQAMYPQSNNSRPSPTPAQAFYAAYVQPEGQLYEPQLHSQTHSPTPRISEQPPTSRPPISTVPLRHALHGPRALISHSRTPSPDLAMQAQMPAPVSVAAGAVGIGGDALPTKFQSLEVSGAGSVMMSPPPGFAFQSQTVHPGQLRQQSYRGVPSDVVSQGQAPLSRHTNSPNGDSEEHPTGAPTVPSSKALGKRRAVEKPVDPDAFDPDDLFKDPRRPQTPLSLYGVSLNSTPHDGSSDTDDDDSHGYYGHHLLKKPIVYAYDAAAERRRLLELEEVRRTEPLNKGKGAARPAAVTH